MLRSPMTMSASPRTSGSISLAMSRPDVLVVGVGVDDEVGAELQRRVDAGHEGGGQALAAPEPDHVLHAVRARDLGRAVARPVVDDEHLDAVDARQASRQVAQRARKRLGLVEAGDLDDQLGHGPHDYAPTSFSITPSQVICRARVHPLSPCEAAVRRAPAYG